jgi:DNA-binding NarL/FixJ family response regulator
MSNVIRPRVLLVDDHREILIAVVRLLKATCDIVGEVTSGLRVIDSAKRLRPDIVVLDLNLPDANGFDVCRELMATVPGVRVVILTALTDPETEEETHRRGASAFVSKWQMADQLVPTIQRVWCDGLPIQSA